jgi:hypothetical protein
MFISKKIFCKKIRFFPIRHLHYSVKSVKSVKSRDSYQEYSCLDSFFLACHLSFKFNSI